MGLLDLQKLSFPEKMIVKAMKAPTGDYRDWDEIGARTESIAKELGG